MSERLTAVPGSSKAIEEENMETSYTFEDNLLGQSEDDENTILPSAKRQHFQ